MAKLQDYELEELYKEALDDSYGTVTVAGMEYETSRALYELDPIAYRVGFNDWLDTLDNCDDCELNPIECKCEACDACGEEKPLTQYHGEEDYKNWCEDCAVSA